jgi:hypothetical protein
LVLLTSPGASSLLPTTHDCGGEVSRRKSGNKAMTLDLLEFVTLILTGFTSCAEFGSYAFVHPVIRHLPAEHHVSVEKGLLKTFGRVMPALMTFCVILSFTYAIQLSPAGGAANTIRWSSAIVFVAALVSTIIFNVPINLATGRWNHRIRLRIGKKHEIDGSFSKACVHGFC